MLRSRDPTVNTAVPEFRCWLQGPYSEKVIQLSWDGAGNLKSSLDDSSVRSRDENHWSQPDMGQSE